jgi:hypothetical protein
MDFFIVLSFFDTKIGPSIFYSYPIVNIEEELADTISSIMDLILTEGYVTYSFDKYFSLNYHFEIKSSWARGRKETLLLSAISDERVSIETEKVILTLCIEFSEWLKNQEDIFKGFYIEDGIYYKSQKNRKIIDDNSLVIRSWVEEFYKAISDVIQEKVVKENITSFIEIKKNLMTLRFLSSGPVTLEKLREWYSTKFPDSNFYNLMINLIRNQLITVPSVGESKKPPYTVYITEDIKEIISLIDLKNSMLKNFMEKHQKESSVEIEKRSKELEDILEKSFP